MRKFFFIFGVLFLFSLQASAAILNVPGDYPSIQAAVDVAKGGDTILLADGTYTGPDNRNIDLNKKTPLTFRSFSNNSHQCTIDCEHSGRAFFADSGEHLDIEAIGIINGSVIDKGGAIYCYNSGLVVKRCFFSNNSASNGGAIYSYVASDVKASFLIYDSYFLSNRANHSGGALYTSAAALVSGCSFSSNQAENGGGVQINGSRAATISRCIFSANIATGSGGALKLAVRSSMTDCTFAHSYAANSGGAVFAYFNSNHTLFTGCRFMSNRAGKSGGAVYTGAPELKNCIFNKNTAESATAGGGALYVSSAATLKNCLFTENAANGNGGAVYVSSYYVPPAPDATCTNCTFVGNSAQKNGGALWCNIPSTTGSEKFLTLKNCIMWDDEAASGDEIFEENTSATVSYSDVKGGHAGVSNLNDYPKFRIYSGSGGSSFPERSLSIASGYDYHLCCNSPCVDTGTDAVAPATDLEDIVRPVGAGVDMGAYEYHYEPVVWKGTMASDHWSYAANWDPQAPLHCSAVLIEHDHNPTLSPVVYTESAVVRSLTITGRHLAITGCLTLGGV